MHNDQENIKFYVISIVVVFIFVVKKIIIFLNFSYSLKNNFFEKNMSFVKTTLK
jgi:uncharacterized membrane protein YdbT with pleckstrin-like domain